MGDIISSVISAKLGVDPTGDRSYPP